MGKTCMALTQITRFMRRWKIERTFAGLQNFRRLLVRQVRILTVYRALFHSPTYSLRLDIYETSSRTEP